jgi:hypothetical protein
MVHNQGSPSEQIIGCQEKHELSYPVGMIPAAVIQLQIMSGHKQGATQWHNNKQHHSGSLTVKLTASACFLN